MGTKIFYAPGDWLANNTNVRQRRAISAWLLIVWIMPGLPIWIFLKDALWFVGFMSLVALWWTGMTTIGTETPVEIETEET